MILNILQKARLRQEWERSGGGAETEYVRLTCTDGVYTNVSDAETVSDLEDVQGVAVLCNDLAEDMQSGNYLTLE